MSKNKIKVKRKSDFADFRAKILKHIKSKLYKTYLSTFKEFARFVKEKYALKYVKAAAKEVSIRYAIKSISQTTNLSPQHQRSKN